MVRKNEDPNPRTQCGQGTGGFGWLGPAAATSLWLCRIVDKGRPTDIPVEIHNSEKLARMFTVLLSLGAVQLHTSKLWGRTTFERIREAEEWVVAPRNMVEKRAQLQPTS